MSLRIRDYGLIKVVQAIHHQCDVRYGGSRGIQCSCMSLRYGNLSSSGIAVLLNFDSLNSLENYVRSVYCNTFPQTLYFQMEFLKVHCSANTKTAIKCALKRSNYRQDGRASLDTKKRKDHNDPEKKRGAAKKRYNNKKESIKQYTGKYLGNQTSKFMYQKAKFHENPEMHQAYQKCTYKKILKLKQTIKKMRYQENPQMQKDFQRKRYKENPKIKIEYQKKVPSKC